MPIVLIRIPKLIFGLAVLAAGVIFTLDNLGLVDAGDLLIYWPLALVAIGIAQMAEGSRPLVTCGAFLVFVGAWFLLYNLEYTNLEPWLFFWPLVLVLIGVNLTLGALRQRALNPESDSFIKNFAMWSGIERSFDSQDFQGGDLTAVMGGIDVDLRQASIQSEPPVLQVLAFWGGIDLRVPEGWKVDFQVFPFMGGATDETQTPDDPSAPTLVVKGAAIMGGVDIKN